jgi:anti-sigma factor RsiW
MNCQRFREMIPDRLAGELPAESLREFSAHLQSCADCRLEWGQLQTAWDSLGGLPDAEPGPALRSRFYAMLAEEKRRIAGAERKTLFVRVDRWLASWWPRRPATQFLTAVAVLAVGIAVGTRLGTAPRSDADIAQLRDEVQQMNQMVSLSLIGQSSSSERLRGVNWSTRVAEPSDALLTSLTNTLNSDPNVNVRIAAVDALAVFRDEPGVVDALTLALKRETSPLVQIALIDLLTAIQEKKALDALRSFVEMKNVMPEVKSHAEHSISEFM